MPAIFEIYGYPVADQSQEANANRQQARCPFMGRDCDGGGNRFLSLINLNSPNHVDLKARFPGREVLPAGICSLQLTPHSTPWIVCPRRLLVLGREPVGERTHQRTIELDTLKLLGYPAGTRLGVWPEVKLKYKEPDADLMMSFDYTFDYIIMPVASISEQDIASATGRKWVDLQREFQKAGYTIARRSDGLYVEDCPAGVPCIIEIMTSSTSGGNKSNRSTIPTAFEDAILNREHNAPGINYRQVWARMVSQLIVKSEIGLSWGGKTIWVVQDTLVDYICAKTALNVRQFVTDCTHEVNMLSISYGDKYKHPIGVLDLTDAELFAGPMSSTPSGETASPSFQDMLRAPLKPSIRRLLSLLVKRTPVNYLIAP